MTHREKPISSWHEGIVDTTIEHIEILYGDFEKHGEEGLVPVARLSPGGGKHSFVVEFLVKAGQPNTTEMLEKSRSQLDFFLVEKGEPDPWAYAKYHCGTAANIYSDVHWVLHQERGLTK